MEQEIHEILGNWKQRVDTHQRANYALSIRYNKYHYGIGLPATILITITGATLLANTDEPWIRITVGIIGIIAAILSAIQTFYSYAKRAETHRLIASQLGQVRRDIEILERVVPKSETEREQRIREINNRITEIDKEAPAIDIKAIRNLPDIRTMLNRAHDKHMP